MLSLGSKLLAAVKRIFQKVMGVRKARGKTMNSLVDRMIATGHEFIELANKMMESCRRKEKKVPSYSRTVISFFIGRATEGFESFLLLLENKQLADSAVLFRSFCEMAIDVDYIYSDLKLKDVRVMQYLLNETQEAINILDKNKEQLRQDGHKVDGRMEDKKASLERKKAELTRQFKADDWRWPSIRERAELSKSEVIQSMYNQVYRYTSNIEHHNMLFGRDYINLDECEPAEVVEPNPLLRPELHLIIFRSILLVIMKTFNDEYHLKWEKSLESLGEKQGQDYREIPKRSW